MTEVITMKKRKAQKHIIGYIILLLAAVIALIPFIWVILSSFKGTAEIFTGKNFFPKVWRFANYPEAWTKARMGQRFVSSAIVTIGTTALTLIVATLSGYSFAKLWVSKHPIVFYAILFCMAIPSQAIVLSIFLQLKNIGLHNTRLGLILALVGVNVPFASFLMRSFFRDLPDSFGECATIDGSSAFQTFAHIYLPLAQPGLIALAIFTLIGAWNEFDISLVTLTDDVLWTITLGVTQFKGITTANAGLLFASSVISFVPIIILYCFFQKTFIEGITVGGNKG